MIYKHKEGVPVDASFKQMLKEYKMSIIEWKTGAPKEGTYLITTSENNVLVSSYTYDFRGDCWYWLDDFGYPLSEHVLAWCPLNEIEPYKE